MRNLHQDFLFIYVTTGILKMNLVKRSITSASWNYSVNFIQFGITFVRQVILARLLDIEVFGIYSYKSSIVFLTIMFPNFGLGSALLNRVPETEDLDQSAAVHFTLKTILTGLSGIIFIFGESTNKECIFTSREIRF